MLLTLLLAANVMQTSVQTPTVLVLVGLKQTAEDRKKVRDSGFTGASAIEVALVAALKRWKIDVRVHRQSKGCRISRSKAEGGFDKALKAVENCKIPFVLIGEIHAHRRRLAGFTKKDGAPTWVQNLQLSLQLIQLSDRRVVSAVSDTIALPGSDDHAVSIDASKRIASQVAPSLAKDLHEHLGRPLPTTLTTFLRARQAEFHRRASKRAQEQELRKRRRIRHEQVLAACEADDAAACAKAAFHLQSGYFGHRSPKHILGFLSRACALGHRKSCEQPLGAGGK